MLYCFAEWTNANPVGKKHNVIPIILLTNTTSHHLQGHSVYVVRNIKFSNNVGHKKKKLNKPIKLFSYFTGIRYNRKWTCTCVQLQRRIVVSSMIAAIHYLFIYFKRSPAAAVSCSRVRYNIILLCTLYIISYKYSYFLCDSIIILYIRVQII
jgi:hypothetical protein